MSLYSSKELDSQLIIDYKDKNGDTTTVVICGALREELDPCWNGVVFYLGSLEKGNITRLDFSFKNKMGRTLAANIDNIELIPKK